MKNVKWNFRKAVGFTLVEMLVVISIIGILATLVSANLNSARGRARDAQRKSDLAQYRSVLESFANTHNGLYPYDGGNSPGMADICKAYLTTYIKTCPEDPTPTTRVYKYVSNGSGVAGAATATKYYIYGNGGLESSGGTTTWVVCSNGVSKEISTTGAATEMTNTCF